MLEAGAYGLRLGRYAYVGRELLDYQESINF